MNIEIENQKSTKEYQLSYDYRMSTGVVLLLNSPNFMQFGIDFSIWTIGEKFLGIKLIPEGPHFISYSLMDEKYQIKQGFFIFVTKDKLHHIRKWNNDAGDFVALKEEDEKNFSIGIDNLDFDSYLGNYPTDKFNDWKDCTKFITVSSVEKLEPLCKKYLTSNKEYQDGENLSVKGNIFFTNIPHKKYSIIHLDPQILTKMNVDKSLILEELVTTEYQNNPSLLLGEWQYAYITFFLGEVYESFEQWKNIFLLVTSCQEIMSKYEKFYCDFIECMYYQFTTFPDDFFQDEILSNNFFRRALEVFIQNILQSENEGIEEVKIPKSVVKRARLFQQFLVERFSFEIKTDEQKIIDQYLKRNISGEEEIYGKKKTEQEMDEDLPVIVEQKEIDDILIYRVEKEVGHSEEAMTEPENDAI